jgi:hypothetical protein
MAISIKSTTSGFRKWSEAQELKKLNNTDAANESVVAAADAEQGAIISNETPHRPWLVPGAGKL